eukprot:COSAG04_NODE_1007_length_8800_cov_5.348006_2_plen_189_part_00
MGTGRFGSAAAALPCGTVLVAGGFGNGGVLQTAELWDPATGAWSDLPPMAEERSAAGCCVLPSGRVAVVGGNRGAHQPLNDGVAFDPEARTWQPLPPMAHARGWHGVVAVAGGMLAVGGAEAVAEDTDDEDGEDEERPLPPAELFDEASGRWFELPHPMVEPRSYCRIVSLPAAAFAAPAAAAAPVAP